jgi:hypothetical protein
LAYSSASAPQSQHPRFLGDRAKKNRAAPFRVQGSIRQIKDIPLTRRPSNRFDPADREPPQQDHLKISGNIQKINDLRELVSPFGHTPNAFAEALTISLHAVAQHGKGDSAFTTPHSQFPLHTFK